MEQSIQVVVYLPTSYSVLSISLSLFLSRKSLWATRNAALPVALQHGNAFSEDNIQAFPELLRCMNSKNWLLWSSLHLLSHLIPRLALHSCFSLAIISLLVHLSMKLISCNGLFS